MQIKRSGAAQEPGTQTWPLGFHLQLGSADTIIADREAEADGRVRVTGGSCQPVIGRIIFNQDIPHSPNIRNLL